MTRRLTCQELVELVSDYLEDALSPSERARFEQHLDYCQGCVAYVEQIRETVRITGEQLREETLPPEMREALLYQFRNWANAR